MNQLNIIGNLTADPVTNSMNDGRTVCNFTVAVNRRRTQQNQQPEADFFRIAAWNKLGEKCQKYLSKGRKVCVIGPVSVHTYKAQDGSMRASMEVMALDVEFLGGNNSHEESSEDTSQNQNPVDERDLPF